MIPLKLRLCNFICYREEQSLDFSGIHLACLTGDNGHGKSSLLDAMTWALWGKARSKHDDDLIALGETEMWVDFEFSIGDRRYRVWRQRSSRGRGQSDLRLFAYNDRAPEGQDPWQRLDDGNLAEREKMIHRVVGIDYNTFVNSAFLLQGRADSFTVQNPTVRKQILGEILNLGRYDEYEKRAREKQRDLESHAERVRAEIASMDAELAHREEFERELETARAASEAAQKVVQSVRGEVERLKQAVLALEERKARLNDLRARIARAERDYAQGQQQLEAAEARLREFETVLAARTEIEEGWARLEAARAAEADWGERLLHANEVTRQVSAAEMAVTQARLAVESEQRRLLERREELARKVARRAPQMAALESAQSLLAQMAKYEERRASLARELNALAGREGEMRSECERLKREGTDVRSRIDTLREESAVCPLCQRPMSHEDRTGVLASLEAERNALADRYAAARDELRALGEQKTALAAEDADAQRGLTGRDAAQRSAATAEAALREANEAEAEQKGLVEQLALLATRLSTGDYAREQQANLARLQAELAQVGYDAAAHRAARAELAALQPFDARYQRQLLPALERVDEARRHAAALAEQQLRRSEELTVDRGQADSLEAGLTELASLEKQLAASQTQLDDAVRVEQRARQTEGAAQQRLHALEAQVSRRDERRLLLNTLNADVSLHMQLREAFGKRGLQALIIETALPEVQAEANQLLARMTDGRMNLRLETQRDLRSRDGVVETLDIFISDELGERPYEMYSGGEAFRANLALRIAISKLLARRSGTQLQTLVIDEGFGTQDANGRGRLVEAIASIQADFERILVITHIDELKDAFPVRIDVVKTASGSRISIG